MGSGAGEDSKAEEDDMLIRAYKETEKLLRFVTITNQR